MSERTNGSDEMAAATGDRDVHDAGLLIRGRSFLLALYKAMKTITLYPIENSQVRGSLDELESTTSDILEVDGGLEMRISNELFYVNNIRLRLDLENFASFGQVIRICSQAGIGVLRIDALPGQREWKAFVVELLRFEPKAGGEQRVDEFQRLILGLGVKHVTVGPPSEGGAEFGAELGRKLVAKQTYQQSVTLTKDLFDSPRMGRAPQLRNITHAVQGIVDQVLNSEVAMMGLSALRDYDDYTFTHTVNVCIFSVAIGRRLGLNKSRLLDLAMAALLHDVGKSRIDVDIIRKEGQLTDEEWSRMEAHTWLGALSVFGLRRFGEIPLRGVITAYEHHMKVDLSGYPKGRRPRELSVFSKIVAVADAYDDATTSRGDGGAKSPYVVLGELRDDPVGGHDPVIVKAFINLLGIYPVGTCVVLDTVELGLVYAANSDAEQIHRPIVRVLTNAQGSWLDDPPLVDLAETESDGSFSRSIIMVTDPERYLINVSDYLV